VAWAAPVPTRDAATAALSCNPRSREQLATSEFEVESGVLCGHGREAFSALVCAHAAVIPSLHCGAALDLRALRTRTSRRSKE
jgi:hypothetical protein